MARGIFFLLVYPFALMMLLSIVTALLLGATFGVCLLVLVYLYTKLHEVKHALHMRRLRKSIR